MTSNKVNGEMFQLRWSVHNTQMIKSFYELYQSGLYSDVTIATEEQMFPCHRLVLSACSPYFRSLFGKTTCKNPVIVLKDISAAHFNQLLRYMYIGEIEVLKVDMEELLEHANYLKIRGLETPGQERQRKPERSPAIKRSTFENIQEEMEDEVEIDEQSSRYNNSSSSNRYGNSNKHGAASKRQTLLHATAALESAAAAAVLSVQSQSSLTTTSTMTTASMDASTNKDGLIPAPVAREGKSRKGYHPKKIRYSPPEEEGVGSATAGVRASATITSEQQLHHGGGSSSSPRSDPGTHTEPENSASPASGTITDHADHEEQPMDYSKQAMPEGNKAGRLSILDNFLNRRTRRHTGDGGNQPNALDDEKEREETEAKENKAASLDRYLHLINGGKKSSESPTMVPLQETLGIDITGRLRQHFLDTLPAQAAQWMVNQTAAAAGNSNGGSNEGDGEDGESDGRSTPEDAYLDGRSLGGDGRRKGRGGANRSPASANIALDEFGNPRLGPNGKPMVRCETCGKELADPSSLYRHRKIHSGEKPHECPFCPRRFIQRYNMRQHLKTHKLKGVPAKLIARLEPDLQEVFLNNRF